MLPHLLPLPQHPSSSAPPPSPSLPSSSPLPFPAPFLFSAAPVSFPFLSTPSSLSPALSRRLPSALISSPLLGTGPAPPFPASIFCSAKQDRIEVLCSALFDRTKSILFGLIDQTEWRASIWPNSLPFGPVWPNGAEGRRGASEAGEGRFRKVKRRWGPREHWKRAGAGEWEGAGERREDGRRGYGKKGKETRRKGEEKMGE